jgi:hypothetical protein
MSPLKQLIPEEKSLPEVCGSDTIRRCRSEELTRDETLYTFFEEVLSDPRSFDIWIKERSVYRTHQRLATTIRKRYCPLTGDASHSNNVSRGCRNLQAMHNALTNRLL